MGVSGNPAPTHTDPYLDTCAAFLDQFGIDTVIIPRDRLHLLPEATNAVGVLGSVPRRPIVSRMLLATCQRLSRRTSGTSRRAGGTAALIAAIIVAYSAALGRSVSSIGGMSCRTKRERIKRRADGCAPLSTVFRSKLPLPRAPSWQSRQ